MACFVIEIDQLGYLHAKHGSGVANQVSRRVAKVLSSNGGMYATICALADSKFTMLLGRNDRFDAASYPKNFAAIFNRSLFSTAMRK